MELKMVPIEVISTRTPVVPKAIRIQTAKCSINAVVFALRNIHFPPFLTLIAYSTPKAE